MATATATLQQQRKAVLDQIHRKEISVDDGMALLAALDREQTNSQPARRSIGKNKNGGLFVRDTKLMRDISKEGRAYNVSLNIAAGAAVGLFQLDKDGKPSELLKEVCEYVNDNIQRPAGV